MKKSEFRNLIREEIRKVLKENAQFKVGQVVQDNDEADVKIVKVYPNKQAALSNLKGAPDFSKMMKDLKDLYTSYRPISKNDDMAPWYVIVSDADPELGRYLVPESHLFEN